MKPLTLLTSVVTNVIQPLPSAAIKTRAKSEETSSGLDCISTVVAAYVVAASDNGKWTLKFKHFFQKNH